MANDVPPVEFCNVRKCRVMLRCYIGYSSVLGCFTTLCICHRPVVRNQAKNLTEPLRICARRPGNFADRFGHRYYFKHLYVHKYAYIYINTLKTCNINFN